MLYQRSSPYTLHGEAIASSEDAPYFFQDYYTAIELLCLYRDPNQNLHGSAI
jgi:hypothetical protein